MKAVVQPSTLSGIVQAPASKSVTQRALACAWIRGGRTILHNYGRSKDELAAIDIIREMGAAVREDEGVLMIDVNEKKFPRKIHCGESGLSARMFTPLLALSPHPVVITGSGTLLRRSFLVIAKTLPELGVVVEPAGGVLPFSVKGPLIPKDILVDGSSGSQFLTGLIMAFAAAGAEEKTIRVEGLQSKPYIDLTRGVLREFGLPVPENRNYREFYFPKASANTGSGELNYVVEADWSNGAFLLVAGAIAGSISVRGLDPGSRQGDRAILDVLMDANASLAIEAKGIRMHRSDLKAFSFDATDTPDLFPPLVALASCCEGVSRIKGVNRLKDKESNREQALVSEFTKMGLEIEVKDDNMYVRGGPMKGTVGDSHQDHRIAMSLSVAALRANGKTEIQHAEAVDKSFPGFFETLRSLGATLSLQA